MEMADRTMKVTTGIGWASSAINGANIEANLAKMLQNAKVVALNTTGKFSMWVMKRLIKAAETPIDIIKIPPGYTKFVIIDSSFFSTLQKIRGRLPMREIVNRTVIALLPNCLRRNSPRKTEIASAAVCKTPFRNISPEMYLIINLFRKKLTLQIVHKIVT